MKRIALLVGLLILSAGCSSEKADSVKEAADKAKDTAADVADKAGDTAKDVADKAGDAAKDMADKAGDAAHDMADKVQDAAKDMHADAHAALQTLDNGHVMLVGTTGCGHCDFKMGNSCSAAVKTANGSIFIIDGVESSDPLFQNRQEGMKVKVEGKLAHAADGHHIELVSYEKVM